MDLTRFNSPDVFSLRESLYHLFCGRSHGRGEIGELFVGERLPNGSKYLIQREN